MENVWVSDLIDTTEMYLRTIYELEEEELFPFGRGLPSAYIKVARPCRRPSPVWSGQPGARAG